MSTSELPALLQRWRDDLARWAIPEEILRAAPESPWVLPGQVFARRADKMTAEPAGPSFEQAWTALEPSGSVLDVGCGAGAASLPLAARLTSLTCVDESDAMLALLAERAQARGIPARTVRGRWPAVAADLPAADVVTCHHVIYNVPDLAPFIETLTSHARRIVVVETTTSHPLTSLNALWQRFHGLPRPSGPNGSDVLGILHAMGLAFGYQLWRRPGGPDYASLDELVDVTRRRLCLPPERAADVAGALLEMGINPQHPQDLGSSGREVLTIWWHGDGQADAASVTANSAARAS